MAVQANRRSMREQQNVCYAINYEVSLVDEFVASQRQRRTAVEPLPESTESTSKTQENSAPNVDNSSGDEQADKSRRSKRDKQKRELSLARARIRYDMQEVPPVRRNRAFLQSYPQWWKLKTPQHEAKAGENYPPCDYCQAETIIDPFIADESVIWVPEKRTEWEDSVSEMTAVCTSAALRRHVGSQGKTTTKPFHAPLSRDYIRDRVDIDDPLRGYQLRHKTGGWLQGFVLWTNFTTWTHYFRWDSLHEASGMSSAILNSEHVDKNGSLTAELEQLPRSGDPMSTGIVFSEVAEIALLGGIGCGEYLLRMALDDIRKRNAYKYVVLQATDSSKTFYERFGFVRVGAVCRYAKTLDDDSPVVGYRHWTHANESETSLQLHGGPSYMMCLKLPEHRNIGCMLCGRPEELVKRSNLLDVMLQMQTENKPHIEQMAGMTPTPKSLGRSASALGTSVMGSARKLGKRASLPRRKSTSALSEDFEPPTKRRKPNGAVEGIPRDKLLSPPPNGKALSYAEKQYHSVWLAVPPNSERKTGGKSSRGSKQRSLSLEGPGMANYHSVRGMDGRFVRALDTPSETLEVPLIDETAATNRNQKVTTPILGVPNQIDRKSLMKQKVKSYPRSRVHYYNRVVKHNSKHPQKYYFVLHYDESEGAIIIVPMAPKGVLTGKREGRPRYQALLGDTDENIQEVNASDFQVVPATMVMKTPFVSQEAWDVEDD